VRVIANRSSGKQGFAVAEALAGLGADVTLVAGPVSLPDSARSHPPRRRNREADAGRGRGRAARRRRVLVAAVADWGVGAARSKLKKADGPPRLDWSENPDILAGLARHAKRPRLLVGFAAETDQVVERGRGQARPQGLRLDRRQRRLGRVMGGEDNQVHLITADGTEDWPRASKADIARCLAERIADALA
jgi:phosphopantothenoylcysteine decarboxylase/phosphopantothenate--cysteine ligase